MFRGCIVFEFLKTNIRTAQPDQKGDSWRPKSNILQLVDACKTTRRIAWSHMPEVFPETPVHTDPARTEPENDR